MNIRKVDKGNEEFKKATSLLNQLDGVNGIGLRNNRIIVHLTKDSPALRSAVTAIAGLYGITVDIDVFTEVDLKR